MTSKKEEAAALVAAAMNLDGSPRVADRRPRVAMNAVTDFTGELTKTERERDAALERLALFEGSMPTLMLDPKRIRPSAFANRIQDSFDGAEFERFKQEILASGGNVQPIKVRKAGAGDFEIVYGHRRHRACADLGLMVLATVQDEMDDLALFEEMSRENEARSDLSPYELALHYKRGIDAKLYKNWAALAGALGKSKGLISRYSALAELPKLVIQAFDSPNDIQPKWGLQLRQVLDSDKDAVLEAAKQLKGKGLPAKSVFNALVNRPAEHFTRVNFPFGRIDESVGTLSISLRKGALTPEQIDAVHSLLGSFSPASEE